MKDGNDELDILLGRWLLPMEAGTVRTPEERAANDGIEAAIEAYRLAYHKAHPDSAYGTLTDWIIVAAEVEPNMEDPDEDVTAFSIIMPGGGIPWYRARGLLEAGVQYLKGPKEE